MTEPFTVYERIVLMPLVQFASGSAEAMHALDRFVGEIEFKQKEQEALKDTSVSPTEPGPAVEIECSPLVKVAIKNVLKMMDKNGKWNEEHPDEPPHGPALERRHIPLWERFVEGKPVSPESEKVPPPEPSKEG